MTGCSAHLQRGRTAPMTWLCLLGASLDVLTPASPLLPQAPGRARPECGPVSHGSAIGSLPSRPGVTEGDGSAERAAPGRRMQSNLSTDTGSDFHEVLTPSKPLAHGSLSAWGTVRRAHGARMGQGGLVPASPPCAPPPWL